MSLISDSFLPSSGLSGSPPPSYKKWMVLSTYVCLNYLWSQLYFPPKLKSQPWLLDCRRLCPAMLKNIAQSLQLTRILLPRKCSMLSFEEKSVFKFKLRRNIFFGYESEEREEYRYFRIGIDFKICLHYFRKSQEQYVVTSKLQFSWFRECKRSFF